MNQREARRALEKLSRSSAAAWIGNKIIDDGATLLQKCTRCGAEQALALPQGLRGPADVPPGFDEHFFAWKRTFQRSHARCSKGADAS